MTSLDVRGVESPPTDSPPEFEPGSPEEFEYRRDKLVEMMNADPEVRDKLIAEIYLNIASMEQGVRGAFQMLQQEGMSGMLKGMIGRRKG